MAYFRGANVHPDYALHKEPGSQVILMAGLPASGKNTWMEEHHPDLPVVSFDDARAELGLRHGQKKSLGLLLDYGAEVQVVYLEHPREVLLARNHRRDTSLSNAALLEMLHKWEVPLPTEAHRVVYGPMAQEEAPRQKRSQTERAMRG